MSVKSDFLAKLIDDGIDAAWLTRIVPTLPDLPSPGTVEESTLTIAAYCDNCNKILQLLEGVPYIDFILRGGQRSSTAQGLLLSALERRPGSDGATGGTTWHDSIRPPGLPGGSPAAEQFQGIGGKYNADDLSNLYDAVGVWFGSVKVWLLSLADQITAAEEAYIAGEEYVLAFDAGTPPVISLPVPVDNDNLSIVYQIAKWLSLVTGNVWFPLIIEIARFLMRRAAQGESLSPLLKLLRKALLVKEGDVEQGMPDHTSILLMTVERAIHVLLTNTGVNAFIEPVWFDDLP